MNPIIPEARVAHYNFTPHLYSRARKIRIKMKESQQIRNKNYTQIGDKLTMKGMIIKAILFISLCFAAVIVLLASCTLSFQNIDTHGTATDLVDENMSTDAQVSPNIEAPIVDLPVN
jgi:hypothetical protein